MNFDKFLQKRFSMSAEGSRSLRKSIFWCTLLNLAFMLPAIIIFLFLKDYAGARASSPHGLWFYCSLSGIFLLVTFLIALLQYNCTYISIYDESARRRISLAEKLRKLPLAYFAEKNLSDLTTTLMEDNSMLELVFSHSVPQIFASCISMLLITAGMFLYNWQMSLAMFWAAPLAALFIALSKRISAKTYNESYAAKQSVTESIQEGLETVQEIKAYNGEKDYLDDLNRKITDFEKSQIKTEVIIGSLLNISYILLKLGLVSVLLVGAFLLSSGEISLFAYLLFLIISAGIYHPISEVFNNIAVLRFLDVRLQRIKEMNALPLQQGRKDCSPENYDLVFENVSFSYEKGKKVIDNISFTARQGQVTALIGPSGGGKTTLAKLAARFWDIDEGVIRLGGLNIAEIAPEELLKHYSAVFQDVTLFNSSVKDNIRIGKKNATDEEIRRAAEVAGCDEFIRQLPEGYDTIIGENGAKLSGGERQRLSIARALLKDAPVILLDEATANLDVENETKIQAGISALIKNKTVLIIAHRMRTIANVHKIVFVKDGKITECGAPKDLLRQNGAFARMLKRQQA